MNISFNFDFLKERKKEIIIVLIYIAIFFGLYSIYSNIKLEKEDSDFYRQISENQYNSIKSINRSSDELKAEIDKQEAEFNRLSNKLPKDLTNQLVNQKMFEIMKETDNFFATGSWQVNEANLNKKYNTYQVKIKKISGTYNQLDQFLNCVEDFPTKATVQQVNLRREGNTVKDGVVVLRFYGEAQS